jgi:Arc/MetJ-type ribon-helix-helix transcriptional regulator
MQAAKELRNPGNTANPGAERRRGKAAPEELATKVVPDGAAEVAEVGGGVADVVGGGLVQETRPRVRLPETEKLTINLGSVDLGSIDLLVAEGFFSNRSDLIRTAVRNLLASHRDVVNNALARQERSLGLRRVSRAELEALRAAGQQIRISVVGLVVIDDDISPELAQQTIASLSVLGSLQVSPAVRRVLAGRLG